MKDLNVKAILIGFLVDIGGTFAFSMVFGIIAAVLLFAAGRDIKELEEFPKTDAFRILMPVVGIMFTVLGGFITGRIAKKAAIKNAFVMGLASALFGVSTILFYPAGAGLWLESASLLLTISASMLGGYLCTKVERYVPKQ
ncbi:MAG: hypothetical protein HY754_12545 [Nitrospirae bacterium]|nr:hypothetical protein [Nitrospirota bacterium]